MDTRFTTPGSWLRVVSSISHLVCSHFVTSGRAYTQIRRGYDRFLARTARTELSLVEWVVLGLLDEAPAHGWSLVRALRPGGDVGRVWSCSRPLVYRALETLTDAGGSSAPRGARRARRAGADGLRADARRAPRDRTLARRRPVEHVRDIRSELMVKLLLLERTGTSPQRSSSTRRDPRRARGDVARPGARRLRFERTLALWRLSSTREARRFVDDLLGEGSRAAVVYRPIGVVRSAYAAFPGMPLQPQADELGRARDRGRRPVPPAHSRISTGSATSGSSPTSIGSSGGSRSSARSSAERHGAASSPPGRRGDRIRSRSRSHASCVWAATGRGRGDRPPRRHARARPETARPALRPCRGRDDRLVRGASRPHQHRADGRALRDRPGSRRAASPHLLVAPVRPSRTHHGAELRLSRVRGAELFRIAYLPNLIYLC